MFTQDDWERGTKEIAPSRFVVHSRELMYELQDCPIDPESFVPVDSKQDALVRAIKGDTEFATDDQHGPMHGPIIQHILAQYRQALRMKVPGIGAVWLALRAVIPSRNLTVWAYPPEAEDALRRYHATDGAAADDGGEDPSRDDPPCR